MQEIQKLFNLANIKEGVLEKVELFSSSYAGRFDEFLITERVVPLLQLHVVSLFEDSTFHAGNLSITLNENPYEELSSYQEYGVSILPGKFTFEEVFETILEKLGFSQIITDNKINFETRDRIFESPLDPAQADWALSPGDFAMFSTDSSIVLTPWGVYVSKEKLTQCNEAVEKIRPVLDQVFNEVRKSATIDHALYLELMLKWFRGKIRVRMLS